MKRFIDKKMSKEELEMEVAVEKLDSSMNLHKAMKNHSEEREIRYDESGNIIKSWDTIHECLDMRTQNGYQYITILKEYRIIGRQLRIETTFNVIYYDTLLKFKVTATKKYINTVYWKTKDDLINFVAIPYGWIEDVVKEANHCIKEKYSQLLEK